MIESKCKLCGSSEGEEILNVSECSDTYLDYMNLSYKDQNRFYKKCSNCGFTYRNMYLTQSEKDELYRIFRDEGLRNETHEQYFERISNLPMEESENGEKYLFLKDFINDSGKHMDIGGGLGVFSFGFKKFFPSWESVVVEPTEGANEIAEKNGITSHNIYLDENSSGIVGDNFDLITANHVVEHVDDPISFLVLLKQYISSTGMICIEMPSTLDVGFLDKTHDRFMSQHEVIYDNKSVDEIAERAGLKVLFNGNYISKRGRNNVRAILQK